MLMERRRREAADAFLQPAGDGAGNGQAAAEESADQRMDRLIHEQQQSGEPAVRSVRISMAAGTDASDGGGRALEDGTRETGHAAQADGAVATGEGGSLQLLEGLSPEQRGGCLHALLKLYVLNKSYN